MPIHAILRLILLAALPMLIAVRPAPACAAPPRELLIQAAFQTSDKARALQLVGDAIAEADRILADHPDDHEAMLQRGIGIGYRAKLRRAPSDARASLAIFQSLAAKDPDDAEAQIVIAGWHLDAIDQLGGLLARAVLGAKRPDGEAAMARAVKLGSDRAFFPGIAALMQIRLDPNDPAKARKWAEAAAKGTALTPIDILMKRDALALLPALRIGDGKAAANLARKLLPFGGLTD